MLVQVAGCGEGRVELVERCVLNMVIHMTLFTVEHITFVCVWV